ncbi:hypothetical protein [Paenibacillus sp. Soil750]|uniref:hypothetical protein n=1 Tax=Paenibacillus sp. Soil750 TaxID=1736398 RepID=UPI0006F30573|nr:hypothetical protein [Paenibacillus sp. Soil750]KRE69300.1 hypothetical protein ASL11_12890 [Paenibacillus sp. Soil750]
MKLGTFMLGGIAGAAAVIYLNRKSKSMLFSAFSSPSQSMGNVMDKAKETFTSKSVGESTARNFSSTSTNGFNQVEKIVKEDPSLKATVNEILQDNKISSATIQ